MRDDGRPIWAGRMGGVGVPPHAPGCSGRDVACQFVRTFGDVGNLLWHLKEQRSRDCKDKLY